VPKFLVLNASPRAGGNCDYLAGVATGLLQEEGIECRQHDLARMKIAPCRACDSCKARKAKYCAIKDDMGEVYDGLLGATSILFLSPIYWFTYAAQLKIVVDRFYGLVNWESACLKGKKVGAVFVYGDVDVYTSGAINAIGTFEHMIRYTGAQGCGFAYGTASDVGDAEKNRALVERVKGLVTAMR